MGCLLNSLKDFKLFLANKFELKYENFLVKDLIEETVDLFKQQFEMKKIIIDIKIDPECKKMYQDKQRI